MCLTKNCYTENCACGWRCYCNRQCYACSSNYGCSYTPIPCELPFNDLRNKYVCFPCRRVWKSSICRYHVVLPNDGFAALDKIFSKEERKTKTDEELLNTRPRLGDGTKLLDLFEAYQNKTSKCAKCAADGTFVNRNFRPCKTEKKWKELERQVLTKEIDLAIAFHDYPRELSGNKREKDKYK